MDRLRKEVAFQRFLARLGQVTPREAWALKGDMGLIARLGQHARGTRDIDTNWPAERQALDEALNAVLECGIEDGLPSRSALAGGCQSRAW